MTTKVGVGRPRSIRLHRHAAAGRCPGKALGGAIATHVRIESPLLTHVLFPIYVAAFVWVGLFLRDQKLKALIPLKRG